ncbi:response regulator transcription factor [Winogradskya consettensis]|uniref:DNA-binding response regulator n=1 Tax=Winogradskya consettensis TaxID=113560 RepID=A0A919VLW3_9ACTN|nr:response regulator transcription factor [Actinoplanes consettensis]GIM68178.1 DNA-binding response regulator [Actinoplanes consettensis]
MSIRVVLADDQTLIRAGFRLIIDLADGMEVVGEATDGRQAVELARSARADVVLMDIRMPVMDGLEATRVIAAAEDLAGVRVVVLTTFEADDNVLAALRAGAGGFLSKDVEPEELIRAIRVVAAGEALLTPRATRGLIDRLIAPERERRPLVPPALAMLTDREREVLRLAALGRSNEDIAEQLTLSPLTVKTHVNRTMTKLGVRDRAQLVVIGYQSGLVRAGDQP